MALTDGLSAYWKLDETAGTRNDSHSTNHLTDVNTVGSTTGKIGNAASLISANNERLSVADNADLSLGASSLTVGVWVYLTAKTGDRFIAGKNDGASAGGSEYLIYYESSQDRFSFHFVRNDIAQYWARATALGSPSINTWYYIVGWFDAAAQTVNIQVNGGTVTSVSTGGTVGNDTTTAFVIGAAANGGSRVDGYIDEVGLWKRVLSAAERTELWNGGLGWTYTSPDLLTSLSAYWKLDEALGARADSHSTNHLTDNNTVTQAVGKINTAAQFTAANLEYLSCADNAALSLTSSITIAAWVYLDAKAGIYYFVSKRSGGTGGTDFEYNLYYSNTNDRFGLSCPGAGLVANGFGSPTANTWYFLVGWVDFAAQTVNLQINNGTVESLAYTGGASDTTVQFRIGARADNTSYMNGRIDEVGLWKRVLSAAERTQLWNGGVGLTYPFTAQVQAPRSLHQYRLARV